MFGFTCLIKADTDLVKRCLQESKNDVELLTALYDEVLDTDTDAEGMWPTEELATPVEEYSLIFGCREASELIYFAEGMRKRALYSAIGAASLALKHQHQDFSGGSFEYHSDGLYGSIHAVVRHRYSLQYPLSGSKRTVLQRLSLVVLPERF